MEIKSKKTKLGHLEIGQCALFICDMQEKFEKSISMFDMVASNTERMAQAAKIFNIPVLATEQYPKVRLNSTKTRFLSFKKSLNFLLLHFLINF